MFLHSLLDRAGKRLGVVKPAPVPAPPNPSPPSPAPPTVESVLAPHASLLHRIRAAYSCPEDDFRQHLLAPITALASWVHVLPGHPGGGFERRGGAIEQALTNCLFSLQAADGQTFDLSHAAAPSLHRVQRWRLACALGGLFVSLPELLARIEVVSDDGDAWPAFTMPLLDWLESLSATKYHYRWAAAQKEPTWPAVYAASRCIAQDTMSFLAHDDVRIAAALLNCVGGSDRSAGQVSDVVNKIAVAIAARERPCATAPAADLLAGTLERLLGTSNWLPNSPGGHVWYGTDGLYLLWPGTAAKLLEAMPAHARGVPAFASYDALLHQLVATGIIQASPSPLRHIRVPGHDRPQAAVCVVDSHRVTASPSLRQQARPLDLRTRVPVLDGQDGVGVGETSPACHEATGTRPAASANVDSQAAPAQQALDFAETMSAIDTSRESPAAGPALVVDTSKIMNPRIRELVDAVVARLDQSFDSMLARIAHGGIFIALTEFVGQRGDGSSIVRAVHDAGMLAVDDAAPARRVVSEKIEGVDVVGIVLRASVLGGYAEWKRRWQDNGGHPPSEVVRPITS